MYGGSTFQGTADSWEGAKDYCTSNQVAGADSASNFCKFSQVGLYLGGSAPTFTSPPIATVRDQVSWYVHKFDLATVSDERIANGGVTTTAQIECIYQYPRRMRTAPTITQTAASTFTGRDVATTVACDSNSNNCIGPASVNLLFHQAGTSWVVGNAGHGRRNLTQTAYYIFDARH